MTRLDIIREMAFIYWYVGDFERAAIYAERSVLESEKSLGRFHPDTFESATSYVVSLLNIDHDAEASEVARVWYDRLLSQGGSHSKAWQLRLKRYAYVEATALTDAEKLQRREAVLTEMLVHLGTGAREYIRCLYSQGVALIAADSRRGYSLIADARRYAESNLGEMDHDTLSMRVPQLLNAIYSHPLETADEYMSFYWKIAGELGPSHPHVQKMREAAVNAKVWTEELKHGQVDA